MISKSKTQFYMTLKSVSYFSDPCTKKTPFLAPFLLGKLTRKFRPINYEQSLMCYFWAEAVKSSCYFPVSLENIFQGDLMVMSGGTIRS